MRDEVLFRYHRDDAIPADEVLKDRARQYNTKTILFMALLGGAGIACRPHGFTIDKKLQKGAQTERDYLLSPEESVHNWAQFFEGEWGRGALDKAYLSAIQKRLAAYTGDFCGYGITHGEPFPSAGSL